MREETGGTFAVLYVGASRLFEQPETGEHRGLSSKTFGTATIDADFEGMEH